MARQLWLYLDSSDFLDLSVWSKISLSTNIHLGSLVRLLVVDNDQTERLKAGYDTSFHVQFFVTVSDYKKY